MVLLPVLLLVVSRENRVTPRTPEHTTRPKRQARTFGCTRCLVQQRGGEWFPVASPGAATLAAGAGSEKSSEAAGSKEASCTTGTAGEASSPAEHASSLSVLRLETSDCEVLASLIRSRCATSSFAEITGNSNERAKTRVTSPWRWAHRLLRSGAIQWAREPIARRSHSRLRDASSVICAKGHKLSDASIVVCAQATQQVTIGKAARARPTVISRFLTTLHTVYGATAEKLQSFRPRAAFCFHCGALFSAPSHTLT